MTAADARCARLKHTAKLHNNRLWWWST